MDILFGDDIYRRLKEIFGRAKESIRIVSPWIKGDVLADLMSAVAEGVKTQVVIRCSSEEDLSITDPSVFIHLKRIGAEVFLSRNVHAKIFIADSSEAVIGSANLTPSGLMGEGNLEVAVHIKDRKKVRELIGIFERIKEVSYNLSEAVGFVLTFRSAREVEALILKDVAEQTYLKIPAGGGFLIGRLCGIRSGVPEAEDLEGVSGDLWSRARLIGNL
ncbi:MAG: phospholipase D family protein, partial [Aquificota bacterium]|nr:phospholipase D family protein [Aquificota bacterium]